MLQVMISVRCKDNHQSVAIEALRRAKFKFPGRQKVRLVSLFCWCVCVCMWMRLCLHISYSNTPNNTPNLLLTPTPAHPHHHTDPVLEQVGLHQVGPRGVRAPAPRRLARAGRRGRPVRAAEGRAARAPHLGLKPQFVGVGVGSL
jgi:hypothetical protein